MAEKGNILKAFDNAIQSSLVTLLVGSFGFALAALGWGGAFDPKDPKLWLKATVFAGALALCMALYNGVRLWWMRAKVSKPPTDRIGILIAELEDDLATQGVRKNIADSLRRELGHAAAIQVWPDSLRLPDNADALDERAVERKAQQWLVEKACDVLIWGRVKSNSLVVMRFTAAEGSTTGGTTHQLDERLELKAETVSELGTVIAARVVQLAAVAVDDAGQWLVPVLRTVSEKLEALAGRFPETMDLQAKSSILVSLGNCQSVLGDQAGNSDSLAKAINAYKAALDAVPRERAPLLWARTQNNLGNALSTLGGREHGTTQLNAAVEAYRDALKERTRERVPLDWAMTLNNLGNALSTLGGRENGTAQLNTAVEAYRDALKEYTRERVPLRWAMTQNNLGTALSRLGERESDTAQLNAAVDAYREALKELTRGRVPLDWAMTQNNLGAALSKLGERESDMEQLNAAVDAYRESLKERTRERVPLDWARTQNNLGNALLKLGERAPGTAQLNAAVEAYREALKERARARVPLDWAMTQNNLGNALSTLGERESGTRQLNDAVDAFRESLKERTRERVPLQWAMTQNNLGIALARLGVREIGTQQLDAALDAYREALNEHTRARVPFAWAETQFNLSWVHEALFDKTGDKASLTIALELIEQAAAVFIEAGAGRYIEMVEQVKARVLGKLGASGGGQ